MLVGCPPWVGAAWSDQGIKLYARTAPRASGSDFAFDRADKRCKYCPASTTGDRL
jgi:hypothetical protein